MYTRKEIQAITNYYGVASGTNTYAATIDGITAYTAGVPIPVKFTNANTGAATININGLGVITLKKNGSADLVAGDIPAGAIMIICYGGTNFQVIGGAIAPNTMGQVVHGTVATTPRPSPFSIVTWIGSVEPTNATNNDIWLQTT